mmetsp:Transcript_25511/g.47036  ORF Transcript_25511/g.47036 Transcript_25511/m.47036 type:complete len:277 (+) Transcript_25511:1760-2590(+)
MRSSGGDGVLLPSLRLPPRGGAGASGSALYRASRLEAAGRAETASSLLRVRRVPGGGGGKCVCLAPLLRDLRPWFGRGGSAKARSPRLRRGGSSLRAAPAEPRSSSPPGGIADAGGGESPSGRRGGALRVLLFSAKRTFTGFDKPFGIVPSTFSTIQAAFSTVSMRTKATESPAKPWLSKTLVETTRPYAPKILTSPKSVIPRGRPLMYKLLFASASPAAWSPVSARWPTLSSRSRSLSRSLPRLTGGGESSCCVALGAAGAADCLSRRPLSEAGC